MVTKAELATRGCPEDCHAAVEEALRLGIDWQKIIEAVQKYGPMIWQIIQLFFPIQPAPQPEKAAKGKGSIGD